MPQNATLRGMDWVEEFFDGPFYARDYQAVHEDVDRTAREVQFIIGQLQLGEDDAVLDLACGAGRHALAIAPEVRHITGVDRTAAFVEQARRDAEQRGIGNADFAVGDMRELDDEARFDAAYNYFTAWGYYDDETNFDVLGRVHRALKPSGRFLLELINRDTLMRRYQARDWHRYEDGTFVLYERRFDFASGRNHTAYRHLKDGEDERVIEIDHHLPASDELGRLLRRAGFSEVRLVSAPDGGELNLSTLRIAAIGTV